MFGVFYTGKSTVNFGTQLISFVNTTVNVTVNYGSYQIQTDGKSCLAVSCDRTSEVTQIVLETPNFSVVSPDILSLAGKIQLASDFNQTLNSLDGIKSSINESIAKIKAYAELLSQVNFSKVVTDNPFKNFTDLRADVDRLLALMNSNNNTPSAVTSDACTGVFASVGCFFTKAASTLIAVAVCIVVLIVVYCIIKHTKCKKHLPGYKKYHKEEGKVLEVIVEEEIEVEMDADGGMDVYVEERIEVSED